MIKYILAATLMVASLAATAAINDPVAQYSFDSGTGTTAVDSTGLYSGSLVNSPVWSTDRAVGAYSLRVLGDNTGTNQYASIAHNAALVPTNVAVSLFFKADAVPTSAQTLVRKRTSDGVANYAYEVYLTAAGYISWRVYSGTAEFNISSSSIITPNAWTHVVGQVIDGNMTLFVNGVQQAATRSGASVNQALGHFLRIGADWASGTGFNGYIDEVRIYNHALTQTDVNQLYAMYVVPGATYQTVSPALLGATVPLDNPGIGSEQAVKVINPAGTRDANTSVEAISTIRYVRLQWSLVEKNGDNQFDWTYLDAAINEAAAAGKQVGISLMGHVPMLGGTCQYTDAIPAWYKTAAQYRGPQCTGAGTNGEGSPAGCTYYLTNYTITDTCSPTADTTNIWTFNHQDPEYIEQQVELINALRLRYDTQAWAGKIAYVDVRGGLGSWTELQVTGNQISGTSVEWPMPNWTAKKAIADEYLKFEYLPIIANVRNGKTTQEAVDSSMWVYLCQEAINQGKTIGWRTDGLDSTKWLMDPVFSAYPVTQTCWQTGPVYGELDGASLPSPSPVENDSWAAGKTGYFALNERLKAWHVSGWNTKRMTYPGTAATYGNAIDEWRAVGGYRLGVTSANFPSSVEAGAAANFSVTLNNTGTAPVYRNYYSLVARLKPASGSEILVPLSGNLKAVLPNTPAVFSASGIRVQTAGSYTVSVGVVQDQAYTQVRPLKLAHATSSCATVNGTYWCDLGTMQVTATTNDVTAPVISALAPTGTQSKTATKALSLTTSETAECRFSENTQEPWEGMTTFQATNATAHSHTISVQPGRLYRYCVRCRDASSNYSSEACTAFDISPRIKH